MRPANLVAERGILGIILTQNHRLYDVGTLVPDDFAETYHGELFRLFKDLIEAGRTITAASVLTDAQDAVIWGDLKASKYLSRIEREAPHDGAVIVDLARTVRDMALRGRIIDTLATLSAMVPAAPVSISASELRETVDQAMASLFTSLDDIGLQKLGDVANQMLEDLKDTARKVGFSCGPAAIRTLMGPLFPETVYYIAATPGGGKSALALQMARDAARQNKQVALFSPEMGAREIAGRALTSDTGVSDLHIKLGGEYITNSEYEQLYTAAQALGGEGVYIDRTSSPSLALIRGRCAQKKRQGGLDLVFIDHAGLLAKPDRKMGEPDAWMANCAAIKQLANDLQIPVVVLAQFGTGQLRDMATWPHRRPMVGDIAYSGAVFQNADLILLLHREEALLKSAGKPIDGASKPTQSEWLDRVARAEGKVEAILGKRRSGGEGTGAQTLYFDAARYRFLDRDFRVASEPVDLMSYAAER